MTRNSELGTRKSKSEDRDHDEDATTVGCSVRIEASDDQTEQQDTMAIEQKSETSNKLRDGPCAEHYIELEKCSTEKKITNNHMVS